MKKTVTWLLLSLALPALASAQTSPGFSYGQVPTAGEWNSAFAQKQDYLGFLPLNSSGGSMTGELNLASSSSGSSGLNLGIGLPPGSPSNGDVWMTTAGLFYQVGGTTIGPLGSGGGGGGSNFVVQQDQLTVTSTNVLSALTKSWNGGLMEMVVNGVSVFNYGTPPPFTVSGSTITWSAANAGYNLNPSDSVVAIYAAVGYVPPVVLGSGVSVALQSTTNASGGLVTYSGSLGTPTSATLTNATGLPLATGVAGSLPAANGGVGGLTGLVVGNGTSAPTTITTGAGVAAALAQPVTGSGGTVLSGSPTLTGQGTVADSALASSVAGLGPRGNLFVWSNCGPNAAGQVCGEQIWVGDNPTATPGAANPEALLVAITNGSNRVGSYGLNVVGSICGPADAVGCTTAAGYLGGSIDSFEDDVSASASYTNSNRAFNPTNGASYYANGPEAYSDGLGQATAAFSAWSSKNDGTNWWHEGVVISRASDIGLHIVINPNGGTDTGAAFAAASIQDDSTSPILLGTGATNTYGIGKEVSIRSTTTAGVALAGAANAGVYWDTDGATFAQILTSTAAIPLLLGVNSTPKVTISSSVITLGETVNFGYAGTTTCTVTGSIVVQINGVAHQIPYC